MADVIPPKVQWRRDKSNFLPNFSHGLLTFERARLDEVIMKGSEVINEYIDTGGLRETYRRFVSAPSRQKPSEVFAMWRAISLALWLERFGENRWEGGEEYGHRTP
jgi:asparagine synthase (glutamine-hydrolysing)